MAEGIAELGGRPELYEAASWPSCFDIDGRLIADLPEVAVFYGLEGFAGEIFKFYRDHRRAAVYIDLGYWGRREGGRFAGYHKISVNARHPTAYFCEPQHSADRFERFGIKIKPSKGDAGKLILLGGMGDKGAAAEGFFPEQWERETLEQMRALNPSCAVLYRPKPSWKEARPIIGTDFSHREANILWPHIRSCVSHHSNLAVDALIEGVQTFVWGGVAAPIASQDLRELERPSCPSIDERYAWASNVAYCQWSIEEMKIGAAWRHLLREGLL